MVIDPEKCLVTVRGKVDPVMLLNAIRETGHSAELFSYQKEPKLEDDEKLYGYEKGKGKERVPQGRRRRICSKKHHRDHEIEDYVPPEIDPEICRDPFCRLHRRRPIIISNCVPLPWEISDNHHHLHRDNDNYYHEYPFDYHRRPSGLHLGRPNHGGFNSNFTCFANRYARTCTIM